MAVIVTGAKSRIAYNIVRSLGQKGVSVHTSDFVSPSMSSASRYSKSHFTYPSPFSFQEEFIDALIENIHRLGVEILIPVYEETYLVAKYKKELLKHVKMVIPEYDQVLLAHNKDKWAPVAEKLNIPIPRQYEKGLLKEEAGLIESIKFPVLIKPKQGGGAWAIRQVNSSDKLQELLAQEDYYGLSWERFFLQEKIEGEVHCVAMLFCRGEYRAKVTYKQLREYPPSGGQATFRISLQDEVIESYFQKMLESMNWHGICQADFMVERRSNTPYLIDLNPRFWGSLAQGIASGVDFPYLLYKIALEGDVERVDSFKADVVSRWIGGDLRVFPTYLKNSKSKIRCIRNFLPRRGGGQYYDDFDIRDPLPFFNWGMDVVARMIRQKSFHLKTHDSLQGIWE